MTTAPPTRILVLGGGFAGVFTTLELQRLFKRRRDVELHFVSDENYFVFQPLLPEIVACGIEPGHILNPIRQLCRHAHFHRGNVTKIDLDRRSVSLTGVDARHEHALPFDHLVLALGMTLDVSRVPGMAEHSLPIKTLGDAFHLRNHVLSRLEEADLKCDEDARRRALTFVAVGGGFSGVETIAEINDMVKSVLRFYPRAQATGARVVLIHSRDRILNELHDDLARFAQEKLRQRGVEIILNTHVKEATPSGVLLTNGASVLADTVICTVGNAPHPLIARSTIPHEKGRIAVDSCLRVPPCDRVWALGDCALVPDVTRGGTCPPTAQYAMRQGRTCARNIAAVLRGNEPRPFRFGGLGQLAVVGRHCGVAQIMGWKFAGLFAWLLWRGVYLMKLPGLRCKIRVAADWAMDVLFPRDITQLCVQRTEQLRRAHYRAGDVIIRQGEIGDRFYVIESGDVEVLIESSDGEKRIATRSAGDSFGEIALLKKTPRTATVRCLTAVEVVTFSRRDFETLVNSYGVLRKQVTEDMTARTESEPRR